MKFMVISFLMIFFVLSSVSALEFNFNYPASVEVNENFTASLSASTSENYDVKIFVQDNSSNIIISEIYNDGWKNPFYYIKSVFPAKTEFLIRAKNYSGNAAICARLRKIGSSSYSEKCGSINIEKAQTTSSSSSHKSANSSSSTEDNKTVLSATNADFTPSAETQTADKGQSVQTFDSERIVLTPKKSSSSAFVSAEEKIRLFAVYAFTGLVIIIVILLAFKKL